MQLCFHNENTIYTSYFYKHHHYNQWRLNVIETRGESSNLIALHSSNSDLANRRFGRDSESWGEVDWPEHTQSTQAALCRDEAVWRGGSNTQFCSVCRTTTQRLLQLHHWNLEKVQSEYLLLIEGGLECHITTSFLFNQELIQCTNNEFNFSTSAKQCRVLSVNQHFNWFICFINLVLVVLLEILDSLVATRIFFLWLLSKIKF